MLTLDLSRLPEGLHVGTSSFSTADWRGVFYPPDLAPGNFLSFYATQLRTVEIDSTWYAIPPTRTVRGWRDKTPEGFVFSAKVPKVITHERRLEGCEAEWIAFLRAMAPLGSRLGPLLLQFPYVAKREDPNEYRTGDDFRRRLARFMTFLPEDRRVVVEVRNEKWIDAPLLDLLRDRGVALGFSVYYTMPSPAELLRRGNALTADFAYVRFLGDHRRMDRLVADARRAGTRERDWDGLLADRSSETVSAIEAIRDILAERMDVYAYFNNHFAGFAPGSIDRFTQLWHG